MFHTKALRTACLMAACCATVLASAPASATTDITDNLDVSVDVVAFCTMSAASMTFANYDATGNDDQTANLSVKCTNTTGYEIFLDGGLNGNVATRKVKGTTGGNTATLDYHLYLDAGHSNNWGETTTVDTSTGTGNGNTQTIPVYGRIPSGQTLPKPDTYTDTVTATLSY